MEAGPPVRAIIIACGLLAAFLFISFNIKISTDLSLFLPEPDSKIERLLRHQIDNGASSNLIFIALRNLPKQALAEINQVMTDALRQSPYFSKVTNNAGELGETELEFVERNRYLLSHSDLAFQFSVDGLVGSLTDRLQGLASPEAAIEKRFLRSDPTGEVISLLEEWQGKLSKYKTPSELFGVWFSEDRERALILIEMREAVSKMENQVTAVMEVRKIYHQIKQPGLQMTMTGPAAFAVESGEDIRTDVKLLSYIAIFLVVVFLWGVYRSFRTVLLVVLPLLMGVITATAVILMIYGQIHGITLAFGITLAGVAVDYPIHLITGMTSSRQHNDAHITRIWPTLRLGVLSTVIAYAAFLFSGFGGLQQLGLFTIIGLSAAAVFSRWVLPHLTVRKQVPAHGFTAVHHFLKRWGQRAPKLRWLVVTSITVAMVALVITPKPILHLNVDSLSPIKDSRRAEGKMLRNDLGFWFGGSMLIVTAADKEGVLQQSESMQSGLDQLIAKGFIAGYDMAAQFLPSHKRQQQNLARIGKISDLESNLNAAVQGMPFKPGIFDPFIEQVAALDKLTLLDIGDLQDTTVGKKLNPLLFDFESEAAGVVLLHAVSNEAALRSFAEQYDDTYYLHLKTAATDLVARSVYRVALVMGFCILIIYGFLAKSFGSLTRPFKIMVPTFSAAVVVAGVLVFSNNPMSIFHLISLLLVIGLGLDYALFFNRLPDHGHEWDTTFKSLWVCGTTTVMVFGVLMFSQIPPLRAIGVTVGIGALMSILFAAMWATIPEKNPAARVTARNHNE